MADEWEKVELSPTWEFVKEKELVGIFVSTEENVGPNKSNLHNFRKPDGSLVGVWGNAVLDIRLKNLIGGDEVKIVYLGTAKSEKTGRQYHNFEVFKKKAQTS